MYLANIGTLCFNVPKIIHVIIDSWLKIIIDNLVITCTFSAYQFHVGTEDFQIFATRT